MWRLVLLDEEVQGNLAMRTFVMILLGIAAVGAVIVFSGMVGTLSGFVQLLFAAFLVLAFASALIILPYWKSRRNQSNIV